MRSLLALVLSAGSLAASAAPALAQPLTFACCDMWASANYRQFGFTIRYRLIPTNVTQTFAFASAGGIASATPLYCGDFACSGDPPTGGGVDIQARSANLLQFPFRLGLSGGRSLAPFLYTPPAVEPLESRAAYGVFAFDLGPLDGSFNLETQSISGERFENYSLNGTLIESTWGAGHEVGNAAGAFGLSTKFVQTVPRLPYGVQVILSGSFRAGSGSGSFSPETFCFPKPSGDICPGVIVISISEVKIIVKVIGTGPAPSAATVFGGVVATYSDGSSKRLGFFTKPEFNDPIPGDDLLFDTEYAFPVLNYSNTAKLDLDTKRDEFNGFDGNLVTDNDVGGKPFICWAEHADLVSRIGATVGTINYLARADFDLDGKITLDDLAKFNATVCTADFNCDGVIDVDDKVKYIETWAAGDLRAEFDGDRKITDGDLEQFLAEYAECE